MADLKNFLAKFSKPTEFTVVDSTRETVIRDGKEVETLVIVMSEEKTVQASVELDGSKFSHTDDTITIRGIDQIEKFLADVDENTGVYSGSMKMDVSSPKGRVVNGVYKFTSGPKLYLTSVLFKDLGASGRADSITARSEALREKYNLGGTAKKETVVLEKGEAAVKQ